MQPVRWEDLVNRIMLVLALLILPIIYIEQTSRDQRLLFWASVVSLVIWLAFVAEYSWGLYRATDRRRFVRENWLDLLVILLSPPLYLPPQARGCSASG